MKIQDVVQRYRELREKKAAITAEYKSAVKRLDDDMRLLASVLMKYMQKQGVESVKTASGTAYMTTKRSARVVDWEQFISWVRQNERWDILPHGVNKSSVVQMLEEDGSLPPGVDFYSEHDVNIRK